MFNMPSGKSNWSHLKKKTCNCGESSSNSDPIIHYGSRCMYSQNTLIDIESLTHSNGTDEEIEKIKLSRKIYWKWKLCPNERESIISIENGVIWCLRVYTTLCCSIVCRNVWPRKFLQLFTRHLHFRPVIAIIIMLLMCFSSMLFNVNN